MNDSKRKLIAAVVGILAGVAVSFLPLQPGLSQQAAIALGILIWAIIWWVFKVIPDYLTAMIMSILFITLAKVPAATTLAAFCGSTWWLLLAAFGLSLGITKCGLMRRISLFVLRLFPRTFTGQVLGLLVVGTVTAPFVPSLSAKTSMLAPLSLAISDGMGYERKSRQADGLFLAMLVGVRNPAPLFISASVLGYALLGQYPSDVQLRYTMGYWFLCALPWFLFVSAVNYFVIVRLYGPGSDAAKKEIGAQIRAEKSEPMTGEEKYMLVIMSSTMLLWTTEHVHGIPAYIVAMAALCLTLVGNAYDRRAFRADINWDSLIFIGAVLGLSTVFSYLGINTWIVEICTPVFSSLAANPYLLVLGIGAMTMLLRFVIVSELAFVNIFMLFMVPVAVGLGINPWVVGFAVYGLINPWFFMYQNPVYMAAYYAVDGKMSEHENIAKYCLIYSLICLAGLALSVPFWMGIGAWGM